MFYERVLNINLGNKNVIIYIISAEQYIKEKS